MHVEALSLFRDCMRSGMRDVGCHLGEWIFASHEDPSDDHSTVLVNEDTSNESESNNNNNNENNNNDNNNNDNNNADPSNNNNNNNNNNSLAPPDGVSVTVGLPTRFGNPASPSHEDADAGASPSPEDTAIDTNTNNIFREQQILRKLTVHDESALRTAIDNLGLKAVLDYVHHFQETQERERDSDAESVDPDAFTRGLEQVCLLYEKENSNARAPDAGVETHDATDVNNTLNQHTTTLHPDPYVMSMNPYMESMSGYYHHPNFCYGPYPPFAGYAPFNVSVPPMYMPMMGVPYFTQPGAHEYVPATADAMNRASRKSRIARRRVLGSDPRHHLPRSAAKPAAHGGGGGGGVQTQNANLAVGSAGQGLNTNDLMFLLAKQLSPSGVSSLGRIVLPKKEAEAHLPHLVASEGVLLTMADFDTCQSWTFRYRFWSNNKSRMYLLENTRDFVKAHNLQERDMLVLYRDAGGSYVVRGEKNGVNNQVRDAAGGMAAVEDALTGDEVSKKKQKV